MHIKAVFKLVKFEHTVFALPFALTAAFMAAGGVPRAVPLLMVALACVFARTAAMSFNRFADASIDAANPRTKDREIPRGVLTRGFALVLAVVAAALFVGTCALINRTALCLSPIALLVLFGYSYTKRVTVLTHFVLGLALALAPLGAWIALEAEIGSAVLLLAAAVVLWTAGFDIIYACSDVEFDREKRLRSIPAAIGVPAALWVSRLLHAGMLGCLVALGLTTGAFGWIYLAGLALVAVLIAWEHLLVKPTDLSKVNVAFFTMNGLVSILFMAGAITDIMI